MPNTKGSSSPVPDDDQDLFTSPSRRWEKWLPSLYSAPQPDGPTRRDIPTTRDIDTTLTDALVLHRSNGLDVVQSLKQIYAQAKGDPNLLKRSLAEVEYDLFPEAWQPVIATATKKLGNPEAVAQLARETAVDQLVRLNSGNITGGQFYDAWNTAFMHGAGLTATRTASTTDTTKSTTVPTTGTDRRTKALTQYYHYQPEFTITDEDHAIRYNGDILRDLKGNPLQAKNGKSVPDDVVRTMYHIYYGLTGKAIPTVAQEQPKQRSSNPQSQRGQMFLTAPTGKERPAAFWQTWGTADPSMQGISNNTHVPQTLSDGRHCRGVAWASCPWRITGWEPVPPPPCAPPWWSARPPARTPPTARWNPSPAPCWTPATVRIRA